MDEAVKLRWKINIVSGKWNYVIQWNYSEWRILCEMLIMPSRRITNWVISTVLCEMYIISSGKIRVISIM